MPPVRPPLARTTLLAYSLPSLVTSVTALPLALFVPAYYADDLGLPLAAVGGAIALSRVLDIVTDPLIGRLSDRVRTPLGRRRPWMLLGVPLFCVAFHRVCVPGDAASPATLLLWTALLYLGFTLIDLPHKAWGAELTTDYDERSRVTGWREALSTFGQVCLLGALVWLAATGRDAAELQLRGIAWAVVCALPVLTVLCAVVVPERPPETLAARRVGPWEGLVLVARNPAFLRMIGCVLLFVSGVAIQGTLHRLVLADVIGAESRFPLMLLVENLATLACVPLWLAVSRRIGKPRAVMAAAVWMAAWSVPLVFLRTGDFEALLFTIAVRGSSFASILFLANSIAADVIDVDTLASGEQRSGLYFAVWGMVTKLSLALGVLLGTTLPAALGYDPAQEGVAAATGARVMLVYGAVPALLMSAGAAFLVGFPIDRARHAAARAEIDRRVLAAAS